MAPIPYGLTSNLRPTNRCRMVSTTQVYKKKSFLTNVFYLPCPGFSEEKQKKGAMKPVGFMAPYEPLGPNAPFTIQPLKKTMRRTEFYSRFW